MAASELGFGFKVGHWSDHEALTGCTVILPPPGNVAACDIRGSSPGSRELAALHPARKLTEVHAIMLAGGSAFGLAAADGAMGWLEERGIGYRTRAGIVPIVPAAVVFDLGRGRPDARPGPPQGRAACDAATDGPVGTGQVGAGTGATVGKWGNVEDAAPGGLGIARARQGDLSVGALAVVNAVGNVVSEAGAVIAGRASVRADPDPRLGTGEGTGRDRRDGLEEGTNTVLAVVATRAGIDKREARWLAARGADGITVSIRPAHTRYDGDVVFCVAAPGLPSAPGDLDLLGALATDAVAAAVRDAVS